MKKRYWNFWNTASSLIRDVSGKGCAKFLPASILEWQDGRIDERCYWTLEGINGNGKISFEEAVEGNGTPVGRGCPFTPTC